MSKSFLEKMDRPVLAIGSLKANVQSPKVKKYRPCSHAVQRAFAFDLLVAGNAVNRKKAAEALRIARGLR